MLINTLIRLGKSALFLGMLAITFSNLSFAGEPQAVNFNTASSFKLLKLDYVSRDLAKAIVNYRDEFGHFKAPADLQKVPGMTPDVMEYLKPEVNENGDLVSTSITELDENDDMAIPNY